MHRLFLCDQLLRDGVGHHLGYNLAIADAAFRSGLQPELVTHRKFIEPLANDVPVHRLFRTDFRANPPAWAAANHRILRWLEMWCDIRFSGDLARFPNTRNEDVVFAQMVAPRHFIRWISWLQTRANAPLLILHLGYRPERFSVPEVRRALGNVSSVCRHKVIFVTDSEKLCEAFEEALDDKVHYLPHIISYKIPVNARAYSGAGSLDVFVPGNARREKGFLDTVEALRVIGSSDRSRNFRFVVQCHSPDIACARFLESRQSDVGRVEWIDRPLGEGEYLQRLAESDIILLPYHLDCYAMRTSGIFAEARVAGIPVVTTRGSWAGDRVAREGGGWLAPERDARELASVLMGAADTFEKIKGEALALAGSSKKEFDRDHFMKRLLALIHERVAR